MSWQEHYRSRQITAEKAADFVKSGDLVVFTPGREGLALGLALAARKAELRGVRVYVPTPGYDFGWYDADWEDSFLVSIGMPTATCQEAVDARHCAITPTNILPFAEIMDMGPADVVFTEISPPDERGFSSFGASLWNKKAIIEAGKLTVAEVNDNLVRTYGDNYIHVSEIDYFVSHRSSGGGPGMGTLAGRTVKAPGPEAERIARFVSELISDGDTIQIGVGRTTEPLVRLGVFEGKKDLGYHSQATPSGIITLVRQGVFTGRYKTVNPGKAVVTSIGGGTREEMQWVHQNPLFLLVDVTYLEDIRVIAAHDNMVAINQALAIDLGGQIAAEGVGYRTLSAAGGQIPFVIGAWLSKGGRAITVLPSTAQGGSASRITPSLAEGSVVTIQRNLADYVVTEYGVARLRGKNLRERAEQLIAIAHPDFRDGLTRAARTLYWP